MNTTEIESVIRECEILSGTMKFHRDAAIKASQRRADLIAWLTGEAGMTTREVGRRLNISGARVTQILNLRKWGRKTGGVADAVTRG